MHRRARGWALIAGIFVACGCASTDLGTPCHLLRADDSEASPMPGHDIVQSGSGECEQFVCASFSGAPAICSAPCTKEGDSCAGGLTCRRAVLDPTLLMAARTRLEGHDSDHDGVDDFQEWASGLSDSLYCGPAP